MRLFPAILLALNLGALAAGSMHAAAPAPPNLIVILTDDQGYADVGFNGCKDIPTPNIDSIARQGVQFTSGYVSYPVCSPSRAGLLTGRYEQRFAESHIPAPELINLRDDPAERRNVFAKYPDRAEEMKRRLERIREQPSYSDK